MLRTSLETFPSGRAGLGLLLLRIGLAASLISETARAISSSSDSTTLRIFMMVMVVLPALALAVGLFVPWVASSLTAVLSVLIVLRFLNVGVSPTATIHVDLLQAVIAATLALAGAGALSIDARTFGRREITIPPR